jgi:arsenate reductase
MSASIHFLALPTMSTTIYHNPLCGTSRKVLQMIRDAGIEPTIVEYLQSPPSRPTLLGLINQANLSVRDAVRAKEPIFSELDLGAPGVTDEQLLNAMLDYPILINRPFVVTPLGTRLCRPAESVAEILPKA